MKRFGISKGVAIGITVLMLSAQIACIPSAPVVKQQNNAPVIEQITYARDAFSNTEVSIECQTSDADGDNLTYSWKAEAGKFIEEGESALWMPPGKMGTYPLTLIVADGKGGEAKETINIRVVTNADGTATPTIEIKLKLGETQPVVIDKQRARIWTTTNIICIVENAEGNQLTYTWSANEGKIAGKGVSEGKADRIGWIAPGVQSDGIIDVKVEDGQGRQAIGQVNIHVFCCGN